MAKARKASKVAKRRITSAPVKFPEGSRVRVADPGSWAKGEEGEVIGIVRGVAVSVLLDIKRHQAPRIFDVSQLERC